VETREREREREKERERERGKKDMRSTETVTHEFCTSTYAHVYFVYCCDELHYKY